jgi:hypothetical protein
MYMAKAVVAFLGAVVTALTAALADDVFSIGDVSQLVVTLVPIAITAVTTYAVPNRGSATVVR